MQNKSQISNIKSQINTNIIGKIVEKTREDVQERKKNVPLSVILNEVKDLDSSSRPGRTQNDISFESAMSAPKNGDIAFIAEIKLASPSEPSLGSVNEIVERSKQYEEAGVDAISVVTEKHFFKGDVSFVTKIKETVSVPILQKDFVIDEYQIYEAKKMGADALLLIARLVDKKTLKHFAELCFAEGIDPVVEVHNAEDLEKAVATSTGIIAVNARDLDTMEVSIDRACELLKKIPEQYIKLGFSGIKTKEDVEKYINVEVDGVLVGTAIMKTESIKEFILSLRA